MKKMRWWSEKEGKKNTHTWLHFSINVEWRVSLFIVFKLCFIFFILEISFVSVVLQISRRRRLRGGRSEEKEGESPYLHVSVLSWYLLWCWNRRNSESFAMASASQKTTSSPSSSCCTPLDSSRLAAVSAAPAVAQSDHVALIRPLDSLPEPSSTNAPTSKGITTSLLISNN